MRRATPPTAGPTPSGAASGAPGSRRAGRIRFCRGVCAVWALAGVFRQGVWEASALYTVLKRRLSHFSKRLGKILFGQVALDLPEHSLGYQDASCVKLFWLGADVVGPSAKAGGVYCLYTVDVADLGGYVRVGEGRGGGARVFHVHQQGVLPPRRAAAGVSGSR